MKKNCYKYIYFKISYKDYDLNKCKSRDIIIKNELL